MQIKDCCKFEAKSKIKAGEACADGEYTFFTSSQKPNKIDKYIFEGEYLIMGTGGSASLHYYNGKFATSTDCFVLKPTSQVYGKFLYYILKSKIDILERGFKGAGLKHTNKDYVKSIEVGEFPIYDRQVEIVEKLDLISEAIECEEERIQLYDELVKSKFVEMFGDPILNPMGWEIVQLSEIAEIKIGPFGTLLHASDYCEDEHPLVNPAHIVNGKIQVDAKKTVNEEKYKSLSSYHLLVGDVVMGRRGEMGRCAVVEQDGLLCGTGSLIIRSNGEIKPDYIQKMISFPSYKETIKHMSVGQTMDNLNVPIVEKFPMTKPPIHIQEQYYSFVEMVECALNETRKLIKFYSELLLSEMNKHFE